MESSFLLKIILSLSLLGMSFIILRNYPQTILTSSESLVSKKEKKLAKFKIRLQYFFTKSGEKIFHQIRLLILKFDNKINFLLEELKKRKKFLRKKNEKT